MKAEETDTVSCKAKKVGERRKMETSETVKSKDERRGRRVGGGGKGKEVK